MHQFFEQLCRRIFFYLNKKNTYSWLLNLRFFFFVSQMPYQDRKIFIAFVFSTLIMVYNNSRYDVLDQIPSGEQLRKPQQREKSSMYSSEFSLRF